MTIKQINSEMRRSLEEVDFRAKEGELHKTAEDC